jgi:hypothetical protein
MVRELGAIIRNQIPAGRKSVLEAYGDILYRAWREGSGLCLLELEEFIQVSLFIFSPERKWASFASHRGGDTTHAQPLRAGST